MRSLPSFNLCPCIREMVHRKGASRKNKKAARRARPSRRAQRGGGAGQIYAFTGESIMPGLGNAAVNQAQSSCLAATPFGAVGSVNPGGLPGFRGGARRRGRRTQRGGRYGFDLSQQIAPSTPFLGGIPPVVSIPCEGAYSNPLNPSTGAPVQPNLPVQSGGVGGIDSAFYAAPTAGYGNTASSWVGSTGAPSMLQIPYDARSMNQACLKTGGGRRGAKRGSRRGAKRGSRRR
jgi:hypothetical protein